MLGNDDPQASIPGEIVVHHKDGFYSYDAKYVDPDGASWKIPAELPPDDDRRACRPQAVATFRALELAGMARVDFFVTRDLGALYVNEVNTIPGFTAVSMYPKMWEASGLSPRALVTRLIELAIERRDVRRSLKTISVIPHGRLRTPSAEISVYPNSASLVYRAWKKKLRNEEWAALPRRSPSGHSSSTSC